MSYYKIRPRSGTASQWQTANPILAEREIGFEYPTGGIGTGRVKMKMGDGSTHWNDLPYATVSPIVENVGSTSRENVPSSAYVKDKFDTLNGNTSATLVTNLQSFAESLPSDAFRAFRMDPESYTGSDLDGLNQYYKAGTGIIIKRNSTSIRILLFYGASGSQPTLMRLKNSSGWQAWQKLDGTNV